jgi:hypothetical protein
MHEALLSVVHQPAQKKTSSSPQGEEDVFVPFNEVLSSSVIDVPTSASTETKKASATLERMTDAIVRVPYVVQVRYQASLPALTHAVHVYHHPLNSSSSLDEEAERYTS